MCQREERDVEPQRAELERRAGDAPRRRRAAGSRRPCRARARGPRGSGGRPRRWSSTAAGSSTWQRALGVERRAPDGLVGVVGRLGRADGRRAPTPVPSSNHAPTERVSAILSQSGLPHECPRWPSPSIGRAARIVPLHAAELLVALHPARLHDRLAPAVLGRRRQRLEGQLEVQLPGGRAASSAPAAPRSRPASSGGGVAPASAIAPSVSRPANAIASALDDAEPSAPDAGRDAREPEEARRRGRPRRR